MYWRKHDGTLTIKYAAKIAGKGGKNMRQQISAQEELNAKDNFAVFVPSEDQRSLLLEKLRKQKDLGLIVGPKCCYTACVRCVS